MARSVAGSMKARHTRAGSATRAASLIALEPAAEPLGPGSSASWRGQILEWGSADDPGKSPEGGTDLDENVHGDAFLSVSDARRSADEWEPRRGAILGPPLSHAILGEPLAFGALLERHGAAPVEQRTAPWDHTMARRG